MARLVRMTDVLPEDIDFEMPDGTTYTAPGDPPLTLILKIAALYENAANGADEDAGEMGIEILQTLDDEVLALLRMRAPELDRSPFGVVGVMRFVEELLKAYNFAVEGEVEVDPTPPTGTTTTRSRSSNGSRSSSKSSSSRRTTT